jgi:hypothetical protein
VRPLVVRFAGWLLRRASTAMLPAALLTPLVSFGPVMQPVAAQEATPEFACQSYCSVDRPGTPIMEVKWRISPGPLAAAELRSRVSQQRLEATVYSDGFDRGLYVTLPSIQPKAVFSRRPGAAAQQRSIPGLTRLVVTEVTTTQDRARSQTFKLLANAAVDAEWAAVRIEGIDPGLEYTYRAPAIGGGRTLITCQAATCPVDYKRAPAGPKSKPKK